MKKSLLTVVILSSALLHGNPEPNAEKEHSHSNDQSHQGTITPNMQMQNNLGEHSDQPKRNNHVNIGMQTNIGVTPTQQPWHSRRCIALLCCGLPEIMCGTTAESEN